MEFKNLQSGYWDMQKAPGTANVPKIMFGGSKEPPSMAKLLFIIGGNIVPPTP